MSLQNNNNTDLKHITTIEQLFSNVDYYIRTIAYLAGAFAITVGIFSDYYPTAGWYMVAFAIVYPHILHSVLQSTNIKRISTSRFISLHLDAVYAGTLLYWIHFSLAPSILLITMLCFALIVAGGIRLLLTGTAVLVATTLLLSSVFGFDYQQHAPLAVSFAYSIGALLFLSVAAYFIHMQANLLYNAKQEIESQQSRANELSLKMSKYLAPQVWQTIFSGKKDVALETQRKKLVVFFSDIKGFTQLSDELEPEVLTELLNQYLTDMCDIALKHGGTIDKFIGDSLMIFFGDPTSEGTKADAQKCVAMAIAMRKHMKVLQQKWSSQGIKTPLQIRMGINTGYCTVGNFGAEQRMDYTIVGKEVNLASRLESMAEAGEILLSYETFSLIKDTVMCRDKGEIQVKGFSRPLPIYQVVGFRKELGCESSYMEHQLDGFSMYLDEEKLQTRDKERVLAALESATAKIREQIDLENNDPFKGLIDDGNDGPKGPRAKVHSLNGKG
jgi:class 3 adenylate cyclase